ncbi:MAG: hypothetical protein Q8N23_30370 [Archangium sp.]|nr:hypothetical protein [Archangium sp.]MDP3157016.1 hypothetical protein [Archangium sp.]MDP3575733.1 hypothetical protein [Archangium sp.]
MKLLGKDITPARVMAFVGERLQARGLALPSEDGLSENGVEARVDPLSFNLQSLEANADATQGLPLETHRDGLSGRAVVLAKRIFRKAGQIFINEALGRQRVFNGHVRDSYAQMSAEMMRLRQRVDELEKEAAAVAAPVPPLPVIAKLKKPPMPPSAPRPVKEAATVAAPAPVIAKPKVPNRKPPAPPSAPRPLPRNSRRGK